MSHITILQEELDPSQTKKDRQSVSADGESLMRRIEGVVLRAVRSIADERGDMCEIFRPEWGLHADPLCMAAYVTIRPGQVRGWVLHHAQDDRVALMSGAGKVVLYDDRKDSPTYGVLNEFFVGDNNRTVLTIPHGVFHAFANVGTTDLIFIDMPNVLYNHANPDKFRLPLENTLIPYKW